MFGSWFCSSKSTSVLPFCLRFVSRGFIVSCFTAVCPEPPNSEILNINRRISRSARELGYLAIVDQPLLTNFHAIAMERTLKDIFNETALRIEIDQFFESSIQSEVRKYIKKENVPLNPHDIFDSANSKEAKKCVCPNCGRTTNALRFVPHLERCVGMGRSSSRVASRRILASSNNGEEVMKIQMINDGNDESPSSDADWTPSKAPKRAKNCRRKDRLAPHHENRKKVKNISASSGGGVDFICSTMNVEQRQNMLAHMCGVVSKHTGKFCTRSIKCPKHTEEQRNNLRLAVLNVQ